MNCVRFEMLAKYNESNSCVLSYIRQATIVANAIFVLISVIKIKNGILMKIHYFTYPDLVLSYFLIDDAEEK